MFELKITGASMAELITNVVQSAQTLVAGARGIAAAAKPSAPPAETPPAEAKAEVTTEVPGVVDRKPEPTAPAQRRKPGPKPKGAKGDAQSQTDLEQAIAAKPAGMPEGGDEIPDLAEKVYEFKDVKDALVQLYDNYVARARAGGEKDETKIMAGKTAYAKQLVYGFGVQKLVDLKPEQYATFIKTAQPYIDGTEEMRAAA